VCDVFGLSTDSEVALPARLNLKFSCVWHIRYKWDGSSPGALSCVGGELSCVGEVEPH